MMNYIWSGLFSLVFYAVCAAASPPFGSAIVESSQSAVTFVIGLTGIMAMWSGLMEVAERTELDTRPRAPVDALYPPALSRAKDSETLSCIIMSFMANIFGAGNSSTVFALRAQWRGWMRRTITRPPPATTCTFAVVNSGPSRRWFPSSPFRFARISVPMRRTPSFCLRSSLRASQSSSLSRYAKLMEGGGSTEREH